jgi:hypothetical protein
MRQGVVPIQPGKSCYYAVAVACHCCVQIVAWHCCIARKTGGQQFDANCGRRDNEVEELEWIWD